MKYKFYIELIEDLLTFGVMPEDVKNKCIILIERYWLDLSKSPKHYQWNKKYNWYRQRVKIDKRRCVIIKW